MTSSRPDRRELLAVLLTAAAGSALVLLAMRQDWARLVTPASRPLPAGTAVVSGASLAPVASPLAVAALAGLAAVLATRRLLRRVAGAVLALFGAGIAAAVTASISAADVLAAAAGNAGSGAIASNGPGSVTGGSTRSAVSPVSSAVSPLTGLGGHATLAAMPWRGIALAGALLVIAAGLLVVWRAHRLPVMSSRYDAPAARAAADPPPAADSASVWESLSRGEDPTEAGAPRGACRAADSGSLPSTGQANHRQGAVKPRERA